MMEFLSVDTVPLALIWARHSASAGSRQPAHYAGQRAVIQALGLVGCIAVPNRRGQTVGLTVCLCIATLWGSITQSGLARGVFRAGIIPE